MLIYKITSPSNKSYIGQTGQPLNTRWRNHISCSKLGVGCAALSAALRKHGAQNFSIKTLLECEQNDVDMYEKLLISKLKTLSPNGYNLSLGGHIPTRGYKWAAESREKLSKIKQGNKASLGVPCSEEKKLKISKALMGHPQVPNSGSFKPGHGLGERKLHCKRGHKRNTENVDKHGRCTPCRRLLRS